MPTVRMPAVAGMFYPADPKELQSNVRNLLDNSSQSTLPLPKAIIAPHAGYIYSGPIAANAYACLAKAANTIKRVVILGPAHRYPFHGLAAPIADYFATPLGQIKIDHDAIAKILKLLGVKIIEAAHTEEHSLEVQLPFLQILLKDFSLVPIVVGHAEPEQVASVLEELWDGPETLIIVSSDLSHYLDYDSSQLTDKKAVDAILTLNPADLMHEQACGSLPIKGLLQIAKKKNLHAKLIDLRNSGDTSGPKNQVVGYAAIHFL